MIEFKFDEKNNLILYVKEQGATIFYDIFVEHIHNAVFGKQKDNKIKYQRMKTINQEIENIIEQHDGKLKEIYGSWHGASCYNEYDKKQITESLNAYIIMKKLIQD